METIFDLNPTDEELEYFGGRECIERQKKRFKVFFSNEDENYHMMCIIFSMRGDMKKAQEYFDKIKDINLKRNLLRDF